jgi:hypothetical protein
MGVSLSLEENARRKRDRMIEKAREMSLGTYSRKFVAPVFQRMIRAEEGAKGAGMSLASVHGIVVKRFRKFGQCVCVTCGTTGPWSGAPYGGGPIETGHFIAGRSASILYEPSNAHPQCKHCNRHLSGNQAHYAIWMRHVYGQEEIDRLERLKRTPRQFTREELVDMRIEYGERLRTAEERMKYLPARRVAGRSGGPFTGLYGGRR